MRKERADKKQVVKVEEDILDDKVITQADVEHRLAIALGRIIGLTAGGEPACLKS